MIPALTEEEAIAIAYAHIDRRLLDEIRSTPDGEALSDATILPAVELDRILADDASAMFVREWSTQIADPASGAVFATTTLSIASPAQLWQGVEMLAGAKVQTPSGHVFTTIADLAWGQSEGGVRKTVGGIAIVSGPMGAMPPGAIDQFVAEGITGNGIDLDKTAPGVNQSISIRTDTAASHAFLAKHVGLYVRIESVVQAGFQPNRGRMFRLAKVTAADPYASPSTPMGQYGRSPQVDSSTDTSWTPWLDGVHDFVWRVLGWGDLGFTVENTTRATLGRYGMLDELARLSGLPRREGEGDASVRAKISRRKDPPSPLGVLRSILVAIIPYAYTRQDIRIYEMGEAAAGADNPYAENFPASMGLIADMHVADMLEPFSLGEMHTTDPTYAPVTDPTDTGLALVDGGIGALLPKWVFVVRVATASPDALIATMQAALDSRQPGALALLYQHEQWGYPP